MRSPSKHPIQRRAFPLNVSKCFTLRAKKISSAPLIDIGNRKVLQSSETNKTRQAKAFTANDEKQSVGLSFPWDLFPTVESDALKAHYWVELSRSESNPVGVLAWMSRKTIINRAQQVFCIRKPAHTRFCSFRGRKSRKGIKTQEIGGNKNNLKSLLIKLIGLFCAPCTVGKNESNPEAATIRWLKTVSNWVTWAKVRPLLHASKII